MAFLSAQPKWKHLKVICNKVVGYKDKADELIDVTSHFVVLECDENMHSRETLQCREGRHWRLWESVGQRPIVFLRFNPDRYVDEFGVTHSSCFGVDANGRVVLTPSAARQWGARLDDLGARLLYHLEHVPDQHVTTEYLFYGTQSITGPDYAAHARVVLDWVWHDNIYI